MNKIYKIVLIAGLLLINTVISFAFEDEFGPSKKIESKYFVIYYLSETDVLDLVKQLNVRISDELLVGKSIGGKSSISVGITDMLDTLYMRVSDILDIHLYRFKANIKICRDKEQLNRIYDKIFNKGVKGVKDVYSFYSTVVNTIYVSADNFQRDIVGHEITHAVISSYFMVCPSIKIQEVLAGYVTYQLRKSEW